MAKSFKPSITGLGIEASYTYVTSYFGGLADTNKGKYLFNGLAGSGTDDSYSY